MVIQYNNEKIAFVHIGGTAGTSIEWYLFTINKAVQYPNLQTRKRGGVNFVDTIRDKGFQGWLTNQHETAQLMYDRAGDALYFSVVRNPYKRMVAKFFTSPQSYYVTEDNVAEMFEKFVDNMIFQKTGFAIDEKIHFIPQLQMLEYNGKRVENLIRFEDLQEEFRAFCKKNSLPVRKLIKCNSTTHPLKSTDIYTDRAKEIVYNHERELIEEYGYHV